MVKEEVIQMVKVSSYFNMGDRKNMTVESLLEVVEQMYIDLAEAVNSKPDFYERATDGQTTDTFLPNGVISINTTTDKVEILTNHVSSTAVTWKTLS